MERNTGGEERRKWNAVGREPNRRRRAKAFGLEQSITGGGRGN